MNGVVPSGARTLVLSGATRSCYQAHDIPGNVHPARLPASLNFSNSKHLTRSRARVAVDNLRRVPLRRSTHRIAVLFQRTIVAKAKLTARIARDGTHTNRSVAALGIDEVRRPRDDQRVRTTRKTRVVEREA